jgi:hypothetical protein
MKNRNIKFIRPPETFEYGTVAVFEDLYGNLRDLLEPNENNRGVLRSWRAGRRSSNRKPREKAGFSATGAQY